MQPLADFQDRSSSFRYLDPRRPEDTHLASDPDAEMWTIKLEKKLTTGIASYLYNASG